MGESRGISGLALYKQQFLAALRVGYHDMYDRNTLPLN